LIALEPQPARPASAIAPNPVASQENFIRQENFINKGSP
jgi:hypothetical protein